MHRDADDGSGNGVLPGQQLPRDDTQRSAAEVGQTQSHRRRIGQSTRLRLGLPRGFCRTQVGIHRSRCRKILHFLLLEMYSETIHVTFICIAPILNSVPSFQLS